MDRKEFLEFMKSFASDNEAYYVTLGVSKHAQAREELMEYIRQNNLSYINLYEDDSDDPVTEEFVQAVRDWNRFNEKIIELEDKYDLYEEIDD